MRRRLRPAPDPEPVAGLTRDQARALLEEVELPPIYPGVPSGVKKSRFEMRRCDHCRGLHVRKCPAVAEIEYHPDGKVKRVVYFPHGTWPADEVLWLEDVVEAAQADDE